MVARTGPPIMEVALRVTPRTVPAPHMVDMAIDRTRHLLMAAGIVTIPPHMAAIAATLPRAITRLPQATVAVATTPRRPTAAEAVATLRRAAIVAAEALTAVAASTGEAEEAFMVGAVVPTAVEAVDHMVEADATRTDQYHTTSTRPALRGGPFLLPWFRELCMFRDGIVCFQNSLATLVLHL